MSVQSMLESINSLEQYLSNYMIEGGSLETVKKIYKGGANPLMVEFPCLILKADTEEREYKRAGGVRTHSLDRYFHILIGCFEYIEDVWLSFQSACSIAEKVMAILETDSDIDDMGYEVEYDGTIEYGTVEFGRDQVFCFGVSIPIIIRVKGR